MDFIEFSDQCQYHFPQQRVDDGDYCSRENNECTEQNCSLWETAKRLNYKNKINMKKDFLGNELHLNDTVVFMQIGYRGLMKGKIVSMSDKKARLKHEKTNTYRTESIQFYSQMIKIAEEDK